MVRVLVFGLLGAALAGVVAVAALAALGSGVFDPSERRDRERERALYGVAASLHARYANDPHPDLPARLAAGPDVAYRNLGNGEYQLCATFENARSGGTGSWAHAKGRTCFEFSVRDRPWMDPSKRRWIFPTC
jgi:hypothetical protein